MSDDHPSVVWLASYPKSGSTWVRAILSALRVGDDLFSLDVLTSGSQPFSLAGAIPLLALDPRWLSRTEGERLRSDLVCQTTTPGPLFRKTHERFRTQPTGWEEGSEGPEPFPSRASRAAIHLVRDPRDVAVSLTHHFGLTLDEAVDRMAADEATRADPGRMVTEQPWGTWSTHARSWAQENVPFPVHRIRYEDLHAHPVEALHPALTAVGLEVDLASLAAAVERVSLDRLQRAELAQEFRERHPHSAAPFFRRGQVGGWRTDLPARLVRAVEADHHEVMAELGYTAVTDRADLKATTRARDSGRRHRRRPWTHLPDHLGLDVRERPVPRHLADSRPVNAWLEVAPGHALVRLVGGARALVREGHSVDVEVPEPARASGDWAWTVQGWAVALAMLQRGHLVLHAATIDRGGGALALAGRSGAGKSTTAVALLERGCRLLVDDVSTMVDVHRHPAVLPYLRGVHLAPDAARLVGLDYENLPHLAAARGKATFLADDPGTTPVPLQAVVVLDRSGSSGEVQTRVVTGAERVALLLPHATREGAAPAILGPDAFFRGLTRLATSVPVVALARPAGDDTLIAVLDAVDGVLRQASDEGPPASPPPKGG